MIKRVVEVLARAKLNLGLTVLGRRDDGFHEIESLVVSVTEPHDVVTLARLPPGRGLHLTLGGPASTAVPDGAGNLVLDAATALVGERADVELALHKRIPSGAGLGGGSADAAAALVGLRDLLELDRDDASLEVLAAELGSDVPFCVRGGAAVMRGRGTALERVAVPALRMIVVVPDLVCSTPAVYEAWDRLGGPSGRPVGAPPGFEGLTRFANDLEPAAWALHPELEQLKDVVEQTCGRPALMVGSGCAYAVCFRDDETPGRDVAAVRERTGALVFSAAVAPSAVEVRAG